jgi:YD repeat-containing protein
MADKKKPAACFTGEGAFVTTTYYDEDGKLVAKTRPSKIKRGGRSKVTPEELAAFKERRAAGVGDFRGDPERRKSGRSALTPEQVEEFKKRRSAGFGKASDNAKKRK